MKSDNELIVRFMGAVPSQDYGVCGWKTYWINNNDPEATDVRDMQYHTSWDWLMPVVEKIGQLDGDYTVSINTQKEPSLYGHECSIYDTGHAVSFVEESKSLIESVYTAVVEFIKWYNDSVLIEREKE